MVTDCVEASCIANVDTAGDCQSITSLACKYASIHPDLAEDIVWEKDIAPLLKSLSPGAVDIWNYGFTEMLNNVIDHSEGETVDVLVSVSAINTEISLHDDGVGTFTKIQQTLGLLFQDVETVGQAFADEVFRVFAKQHPNIHLSATNVSDAADFMIKRARAHR
ncbi:MAG: DUF4325 domain-containing protein [Cyanobacteria bacterium J06554_11]